MARDRDAFGNLVRPPDRGGLSRAGEADALARARGRTADVRRGLARAALDDSGDGAFWRTVRIARWFGVVAGFLLLFLTPQAAGLGILLFVLSSVGFALDTPAQRADRRRRREAR